jgi:hypothetical protein
MNTVDAVAPVDTCPPASFPSLPILGMGHRAALWIAVFLVSVPVLFQASLVRWRPELSLALTAGWLMLALYLCRSPKTRSLGDLLVGFTWTWLAGSIYWGWLRWEPLFHLPIEAIGLPLAIACLARRQAMIGSWFYLGSLFGTVVTDVYFYITNVIPHWRQLMIAEPDWVHPIFQAAIANVTTPWGVIWGLTLAGLLIVVGAMPLQMRQPCYWAFSGAVLSTLLVDGLFLVAAIAA